MTDEEKGQVLAYRGQGMGYKKIANILGVTENAVKGFCKRQTPIEEEIVPKFVCRSCGKAVEQNHGRKEKKFCSDKCRNKWWNAHLDKVNRKAEYDFVCAYCKKPFRVYGNKNRKYCSHECYIHDRFGGGSHD